MICEQFDFFGGKECINETPSKEKLKQKTTPKESSKYVFNYDEIIAQFESCDKYNKFLNNYKNNLEKITTIEYDDFLSKSETVMNLMLDLCVEDGTFLLQALTSAGKTYLVNKLFEILSTKYVNRLFIIATPNKVQNLQNEQTEGYIFKALVGGEKIEKLHTFCNTVSAVYDKVEEIYNYCSKYHLDVTLIIDESQQLIQASNFRKKALKGLAKMQDVARTTIHISATVRENLLSCNYDRFIKCVPKNKPINIDKIIVGLGEHKNIEMNLLNLIEFEVKEKKQVLVFLDNKEKISELFKGHLTKKFKNKKIAFLDSNQKQSEIFKKISKDSLIPKDIDILVVTSVLECGTNINNENLTIFYVQNNLNYFSTTKVAQSLARARKKQERAYFLSSKPSKETDFLEFKFFIKKFMKRVFFSELSARSTLELFKAMSDLTENEAVSEFSSLLNNGMTINDTKIAEYIRYDSATDEFYFDEGLVIQKLLNKFDLQYFSHKDFFIDFFKDECKAGDVSFFEFSPQDDEEYKNRKKVITKEKQTKRKEEKLKKSQHKDLIKKLLDDKLIDVFKNLGECKEILELRVNKLNEEQKKLYYELDRDTIEELIKIYKHCNKEHKRYQKIKTKNYKKIDYYIDYKEALEIYLNSSNFSNFKEKIKLSMYTKFNKQSWSKDKETLQHLKETYKLEFAFYRLYFDNKIKSRVTEKMLQDFLKELHNEEKELSECILNKTKKVLNAIYVINKDNKISSIKTK